MSTTIELLIPIDLHEIRLRGQLNRLPDPAPRAEAAPRPAHDRGAAEWTAGRFSQWIPRVLAQATASTDRLIFGTQGAPTRMAPAKPPVKVLVPAAKPSEAVRPSGSPLAPKGWVPGGVAARRKGEATEALQEAIRELDRWTRRDPAPLASSLIRS